MLQRTVLKYAAFLLMLAASVLAAPIPQADAEVPLDLVILQPGDARSLTFSLHNYFGKSESLYNVIVVASAPDGEIHRLRIAINPTGDINAEITFFTFGIFKAVTGTPLQFYEVLEPKSTYGFDYASYLVDINPRITVGYIFISAGFTSSSFDFPLDMTMTLTLEN